MAVTPAMIAKVAEAVVASGGALPARWSRDNDNVYLALLLGAFLTDEHYGRLDDNQLPTALSDVILGVFPRLSQFRVRAIAVQMTDQGICEPFKGKGWARHVLADQEPLKLVHQAIAKLRVRRGLPTKPAMASAALLNRLGADRSKYQAPAQQLVALNGEAVARQLADAIVNSKVNRLPGNLKTKHNQLRARYGADTLGRIARVVLDITK